MKQVMYLHYVRINRATYNLYERVLFNSFPFILQRFWLLMAKAPEPQGLISLNLDSECSQELVMEPLETAEATKMGPRPS